jgi:branched-chain amino acid aminotransferase
VRATACIDGHLVPLEGAQLPLSDRGFLYGDAVFEALRTFRGVPDALDRHLERLESSCSILGIKLGVSRAQLSREVALALAHADGPEAYIRIMVTRGDRPESLPPRGAGAARRVVIVRTFTPTALDHVHTITLMSCIAPPSALWAGAKPSAYINNLLAIGKAQAADADDALLLGAQGELLEGATSSAFLVNAVGEVLTPPVALGILPGITRERVLQCARQSGLTARERLLTIHDVYRCSEMFMTSSVRGLVAVSHVDGLALGSRSGLAAKTPPGPMTNRIFDAYRELVSVP